MTTVTATTVVNQTRPYDYIYDKHHTVSDQRDHARASYKAHTQSDRVAKKPVFNNMYSEMRHYPNVEYKMKAFDPVPQHMNKQWTGYMTQAREALNRFATFNYTPHLNMPSVKYDNVDVGGMYRSKFFKRPLIPFLQQLSPEWVLAGNRTELMMNLSDNMVGAEARAASPFLKTVQIQTDYRDSEAQTDPYSPEFVVRPGSQPELLTLATLAWKKGLPAGKAEVDMIERARKKRAWEASLPPLSDPTQWERRRKMMDQMEMEEWGLREGEIEKLQEQRLQVLKQLLKRREQNNTDLNNKRLDQTWTTKQSAHAGKLKQLKNNYIRCLRKLTKGRQNVEGRLKRKDIVEEYVEPGSQTQAPLTRIGQFPDRNANRFQVKSHYLNTYEGLCDLEAWLSGTALKPHIAVPRPKTVTKDGYLKRSERMRNTLDKAYDQIQQDKAGKAMTTEKPLRFVEKIEKPVPRPPTPSIQNPDVDEEDLELSVTLIQQLLRGRAIQNMMTEGINLRGDLVAEMRATHGILPYPDEVGEEQAKMFEGQGKREELIAELRSTHALQKADKEEVRLDREKTQELQRHTKHLEHKEMLIDETISALEASALAEMFDTLSKELVRLQEERRIHAFAMLAERRRRIREAEESGRRQTEERRRREVDEMFKQVTKVHQETVDAYLGDIVVGAKAKEAATTARAEIEARADAVDELVTELQQDSTKLFVAQTADELVHSFLLPHVNRDLIKHKVKQTQMQLLKAAHQEIHKDSQKSVAGNSKPLSKPQYMTQIATEYPEDFPSDVDKSA